MRNYKIFSVSLFALLLSCTYNPNKNKSLDYITDELKAAIQNYSDANPFHEGLSAVQKNGKWGYIDKRGNLIIKCKYDEAKDFYCNRAEVHLNGMEGCIDSEGSIIVDIKYESISFNKKDSTFIARLNDKVGVLDYNGKEIVSFEYQEIWNYHEGLMAAKKDSHYGFIDKLGNVVIPFKFDKGGYFSEGLAKTELGGKEVYIDKYGQVKICENEVYSLAGTWFKRGFAPVVKRTRMSIYDYDLTNFHMSFINKNGELIYDWIKGEFKEFSNNYYTFRDVETNLYGLVDLNLRWVLKPEFRLIGSVNEDGLVYVETSIGKAGIFDVHKNAFIIPCKYNIRIKAKFIDGCIPVEIYDKVGYLNKSDELQIVPKYDNGSNFSEGFAVVYKFGIPGFVDRYGNDTFE